LGNRRGLTVPLSSAPLSLAKTELKAELKPGSNTFNFDLTSK